MYKSVLNDKKHRFADSLLLWAQKLLRVMHQVTPTYHPKERFQSYRFKLMFMENLLQANADRPEAWNMNNNALRYVFNNTVHK